MELPNHLNSIELPENDSSESLTILNLNQELKLKRRIFFFKISYFTKINIKICQVLPNQGMSLPETQEE